MRTLFPVTAKLYRLRWWKAPFEGPNSFFTCARPGRKQSSTEPIPDRVVRTWLDGVLRLGADPTVISMLGCKKNGMSEYDFYSFHGGWDRPADRPGRPSFREWLGRVSPDIVLHEHPTVDCEPVPADVLDAISTQMRTDLARGRTVVIVDSGGMTRTSIVGRHLGASEAFSD
jgi:hypothetical protein